MMWQCNRSEIEVEFKGESFTVKQLTAREQAQYLDRLDDLKKEAKNGSIIDFAYHLFDLCLDRCSIGVDLRDEQNKMKMEFVDSFSLSDLWDLTKLIAHCGIMGDVEKKSSAPQEPSGTDV